MKYFLIFNLFFDSSDGNLQRDKHMKDNMDNQGWIPISLIAGFNRVIRLGLYTYH